MPALCYKPSFFSFFYLNYPSLAGWLITSTPFVASLASRYINENYFYSVSDLLDWLYVFLMNQAARQSYL